MIISYSICAKYRSFICVPKGVTWKLGVDVWSMGEDVEEEDDLFANYCVKLTTGDGVEEVVLMSEDYQYSEACEVTDDDMLNLFNLVLEYAAEDAAHALEKGDERYDLDATVDKALFEWRHQLAHRAKEE